MSNIIQINNLNKSFGSVNAVQNLSFRVKKGELFAFLGINGAGKSTTINIMCGQLSKDSGSVFIDKHDLDKDMDYIKRELGVVFQSSVLDSALSVYDNLESRAALYGITGMEFKKRLEELAKILDFENLLKRTVGKLSGGQRRRIDIARALFHNLYYSVAVRTFQFNNTCCHCYLVENTPATVFAPYDYLLFQRFHSSLTSG